MTGSLPTTAGGHLSLPKPCPRDVPHPQELLNASHPNPRSPTAHMISLVSPLHHPTGTHTHTWGDILDTHSQAHGMAHTPPQAQGQTWLVQALHR